MSNIVKSIEIERQIEINVIIEEMISKYKEIEWKTNKFIKGCNINIDKYQKSLKKFEKLKIAEKEDESFNIRYEIFKRTCEGSINLYRDKIIDAEEKNNYDLSALKQQIISILNEAFVNDRLNEHTIIKQGDFIVYSVPSAKLRFSQLKPIIYDEELLIKCLKELHLEEYFSDIDNKLNWDQLKKDLEIEEDGSISISKNGVILNKDGVRLSDPELIIKFL